jgi:hypothetical protein
VGIYSPISLTLLDWNQLTFNLECISAHPIILVTFYYKTFFFDPESVMVNGFSLAEFVLGDHVVG